MIMELGGWVNRTGKCRAVGHIIVYSYPISCICSRRSHPMAHGLPPLSGGFWSVNNTMFQDRLLFSGPMVQALITWI